MGLDVALLNLLSIALAIETFKKIEGEKLEERLKNKSNEEIKEILLSKNLPASKEQTKLLKESRKNFQNQVTRNLKVYWSKEKKESKVYHLGQNTTYFSISEVLNDLIKRDYPELDTFDGTKTLRIFIPEIPLIKCPKIMDEKKYLQVRDALRDRDPNIWRKFEGEYTGNFI